MRYRAELSKEAEDQLSKLPRKVRDRLERAIDELEEKDDSQWSNMKALQGPQWKGRLRKRVGDYRIIMRKSPHQGVVEISAILVKAKGYLPLALS
jgi:mRNA-degrading endonuclease RelE of RelBE toxin-antitoxin system